MSIIIKNPPKSQHVVMMNIMRVKIGFPTTSFPHIVASTSQMPVDFFLFSRPGIPAGFLFCHGVKCVKSLQVLQTAQSISLLNLTSFEIG